MGNVSSVELDIRENSSILVFPVRPRFDTGERRGLGLGDFPNKTAIIAGRSTMAVEYERVK